MTGYDLNPVIIEGKTKIVRKAAGDERLAILEAKDDITAGDGAKHDIIAGKAQLATITTCNVFQLLAASGIPMAFREQLDSIRFLAECCVMLPYEVVVRREAHGSYLKRHPYLKKGHIFPKLILEFFLKTKDKMWRGNLLSKDDPYIDFGVGWHPAHLHHPDKPVSDSSYILTLDDLPMIGEREVFESMGRIAREVFLVLEKAWQLLGRRLVDYKVEFGFNTDGELVLADVIDNDSWRVIHDGRYIDKQVYRDGAPLNEVTARYREVAELTRSFALPKQLIILWRGSDKDDLGVFQDALLHFGIKDPNPAPVDCQLQVVTCSAHKETVQTVQYLIQLVQQIPDAVIIVYVGRSNGLGPTLASNTSVPVITVPANFDKFPEDVWSSLRTPSDNPLMTVLDPKNAVLAALQILAMRNPRIYAKLHIEQEKRFINVVKL